MRDITDILGEWPYDVTSCVRKIRAGDGRELLQVRTPLGIEQYELEGRPDGARPHGCESILDYLEGKVIAHMEQSENVDDFEIDAETATQLQEEGLLYYYRYTHCFRIGEYAIVARDTARNLRMFDFIRAYCKDEDTVHSSEQYRPYVVRMNAAARALIAIGAERHNIARSIVGKALDAINAMPDVPTATFEYEKRRSLAILRGMLRAIPDERPPTPEETIARELQKAIREEDYERAAELRDQLREMTAGRQHLAGPGPQQPL